MAARPSFKVFPVAGWDDKPAYILRNRDGSVRKVCSKMAFWDDFLAPRGQYLHHANDIVSTMGAYLLAVTDGVAWPNVELGDRPNEWSYFQNGGWHFYIRGDDGHYYYYAHMLARPLVPPGRRVRAGQIIGYLGRSGNTAACPHLHFAVYKPRADGSKGIPINPRPYLLATRPSAKEIWKPALITGAGIFGVAMLVGGAWLIWRHRKKKRSS